MSQPSGEGSPVVETLITFIQHYGPVPLLISAFGLIWKSSAKLNDYKSLQDEHARRLDEHKIDIAALKAADAANRVTIAGLPTRSDLREVRDEMRSQAAQTQAQLQSGFENVIRMIRRED